MCLKIGMYRDGQKHMSYVGCGNSPLRSGGGITQPVGYFFFGDLCRNTILKLPSGPVCCDALT